MTGKIIDGLAVAHNVKKQVKKAVDELKSQGIQASLATILVGDDLSSATYIKNKQKAAEDVGSGAQARRHRGLRRRRRER